ncbi:gamma-butyrobetaine hydroxylase-like domain-containing protein [Leptolinea tardivitalis]|uniref:Gamma-butyrobetaine hydroxylase-like N-terminal domain-containing protein n=1 Tax=Leptolinea tardivitalis TaxID=229920 RepID=A0A0P6XAQ9_9CHLR|nr:DUF971 domain-containing protein [Leptolinea tardivitalis]KPL71717.1 hypothetical protein ADM99_09680 [Leptolinea tardivitalis]GAP20073.1 uncharacterized protein conserved in bacteria [Leptolinea tardivitalis]
MSNLPKDITADKSKQELTVIWKDGHISRYPFTLLRAGCPCAVCRGGHEKMSQDPDPAVFDVLLPDSPAVHLRRADTVGTYALAFEWEDGHHEGIFSWDYLRALCPCDICRG